MIKRKGQIIPRNLAKAMSRKYQHLFVFGCDVEITGNKVKPLDGGTAIFYPQQRYVKKGGSNIKVRGVNFLGCFSFFDALLRVDNIDGATINCTDKLKVEA
jgi:hypothetical protein